MQTLSTSPQVFGIDLGTTNSCISVFENGAFRVVPIDGQATVPSVVAWDGSHFLVGKRAVNYGMVYPDLVVRSIKRLMGQPTLPVSLGPHTLTPVEVSSIILKYLKNEAAAALGTTVSDVVITVPAWFNEPQRRATLTAGLDAGLNVLQVINEPTAAALAYDVAQVPDSSAPSSEKWLVFDLGGGTFDVSVLNASGSFKEVLSSCGNTFLGGDDFDNRITLHFLDHLKDRYNQDYSQNKVVLAQLRHSAESAKITLSTYPEAKVQEIISVGTGAPLELDMTLTRETFNDMIETYIESMLAKTRQALDEAQVIGGKVDRLLFVGGSTRIPAIRQAVSEAFQIEPDAYIDPDLSVAMGASIRAALEKGLTFSQVMVDVSPHTLGVAAWGAEDLRYQMMPPKDSDLSESDEAEDEDAYPHTFSPIIRRNTRLPAKFVDEFYTGVDNQEKIKIMVFQGESANTHDNTLVGSFTVDIAPMPAGSPVHVGFEYDISGMVKISVSEKGTSAPLHTYALSLNTSPRDKTHGIDVEPVKNVTNFLIERVKSKLAAYTGSDGSKVKDLLSAYEEVLKAGDDTQLDRLEESLYDWLDKVQSQAQPSHV